MQRIGGCTTHAHAVIRVQQYCCTLSFRVYRRLVRVAPINNNERKKKTDEIFLPSRNSEIATFSQKRITRAFFLSGILTDQILFGAFSKLFMKPKFLTKVLRFAKTSRLLDTIPESLVVFSLGMIQNAAFISRCCGRCARVRKWFLRWPSSLRSLPNRPLARPSSLVGARRGLTNELRCLSHRKGVGATLRVARVSQSRSG